MHFDGMEADPRAIHALSVSWWRDCGFCTEVDRPGLILSGCYGRGGKAARLQAQALHCMHVSVRVRARRLMIGNSFLPRRKQGGMAKAECRLQGQIQLAARVHMFYD